MGSYDIAATGAWDSGTIHVSSTTLDYVHVYLGRGASGSPVVALLIPLETAGSIGRDLLNLVEEAKGCALNEEPDENIVRIVTKYSKDEYPSEYVAARVNGNYEWVVTGSERDYSWGDLIEYFTDGEETIVSITPLKEDK